MAVVYDVNMRMSRRPFVASAILRASFANVLPAGVRSFVCICPLLTRRHSHMYLLLTQEHSLSVIH